MSDSKTSESSIAVLPLPSGHSTTAVIYTHTVNELAVDFHDSTITINGRDIIIKTLSGDVLILPLAAEMASFQQNLFSIKFSDGTILTSDQILQIAKVDTISPESTTTTSTSENQTEQNSLRNEKSKTEEKIVKVETVIVVPVNDNTSKDNDTSETSQVKTDNASSKHTSDADAKPLILHQYDVEPVKIVIPKTSGNTVVKKDSEYPVSKDIAGQITAEKETHKLTLLQYDAVINDAEHIYLAGAATNGASVNPSNLFQYGIKNINLANEQAPWSIYIDDPNRDIPGYLTRVIDVKDATVNVSITGGLPEGYRTIEYNSAQGNAYGLKQNQILLIYPEGRHDSFRLTFNYTSTSGVPSSFDAGFVIVDSPALSERQDGYYELKSSRTDFILNGTSGSDSIYAGLTSGTINANAGDDTIYSFDSFLTIDGGEGIDSVNYSTLKTPLMVDLKSNLIISGERNIAALANVEKITTGEGDDRLLSGSFDAYLYGGNGNDTFTGGTALTIIDGGAGVNTLDLSESLQINGADINLLSGTSGAGKNGFGGTDHYVNIQNIIGSIYSDTITGNDDDNAIVAGSGDDIVFGSKGNDQLDGQSGINTLDYSNLNDKLYINLSSKTTQKENGDLDSFQNFKNIVGGESEDTFSENESSYNLYGGKGNDSFIAGVSSAIYDGGEGIDNIDYSHFQKGINANFKTKITNYQSTDIHSILNIEIIKGTDFNDIFTVGDSDIRILGGRGDDNVIAGEGITVFDGGEGSNSIDYTNVQEGIIANLDAGLITVGAHGTASQKTDTISNVLKVTGSNYADVITGNDGDNSIITGAGDDVIISSNGNDTIDGGVGIDSISYSRFSSGLTINLNTGDVIKTNTDKDHIINIEKITSGSGDDLIVGSTSSLSFIDGGEGVDTLSYSGIASQVYIDLARNKVSTANYTLSAGGLSVSENTAKEFTISNIENVIGGDGISYIKASSIGGEISSSNSNKVGTYIIGNDGNHTYIGNTVASELVFYSLGSYSVNTPVTVTIDASGDGSVNHGQWTDLLTNVNGVIGSDGDDIATIDRQDFIFSGGKGNDSLSGGTISYYYASEHGVTVDLGGAGTSSTGVALDDGFGYQDTLNNVNDIVGTYGYNDTIWGNDNNNTITEYGGRNIIYGSNGDDKIIFNGGSNILDYSYVQKGITLNMSLSKVTKGASGTDIITGVGYINEVHGTAKADIITGNDSNNIIYGGGGSDVIIGGKGNDSIFGATDLLSTASYETSIAGIEANLNSNIIKDGFGGTDTLSQIGGIRGSGYNDVFNFTSSADLQKYKLDGSGGTGDSLVKKGNAGTYSFDSNVHISGIENINFNDSQRDTINIDLNSLFNGNSSSRVILNADNIDTFNITQTDWTSVHSTGTDIWTSNDQKNSLLIIHS